MRGHLCPVGKLEDLSITRLTQGKLGYTIKRIEIATVQSLVSIGTNIIWFQPNNRCICFCPVPAGVCMNIDRCWYVEQLVVRVCRV